MQASRRRPTRCGPRTFARRERSALGPHGAAGARVERATLDTHRRIDARAVAADQERWGHAEPRRPVAIEEIEGALDQAHPGDLGAERATP